jgi:hypothetical protein
MLALAAGSQPLPTWARGPLSVPYKPDTLTYRLQAGKGQGMCPRATTCPVASEPASLLREGSDVVMCPKALDPVSRPRKALVLPRVTRLQTPPHHPGELQHYHASLGTGPRLSTSEGSSADTCPSTSDCAPPQRWAPMLTHGPWLSVGRRDKERLSCNDMPQGSCVSKTCGQAAPRYNAAPHR